MNTTRIEHIASAIDFLNDRSPHRYTVYQVNGGYNLHQHPETGGVRTVLSARTKREFLALVEAYTHGVRDHA